MEFDQIMTLIGSFGFPIVMCILFWHYISTAMQNIENIVAKNTEALNTLVLKLDIIDAINQREIERQKSEKKS